MEATSSFILMAILLSVFSLKNFYRVLEPAYIFTSYASCKYHDHSVFFFLHQRDLFVRFCTGDAQC